MKVDLQTGEIILSVNGQEMTFSEDEIISILKEHFERKDENQDETKKVQRPTEGKWFQVTPMSIDQALFAEKREDERQEKTRMLILEAFEELKKNSRYTKPFKTLMPKEAEDGTNVEKLKARARNLGDHIANWVEQALEWAQRINNGESWEDICNKQDTADWYRLVVWKNGYARLIGNSYKSLLINPASYVGYYDFGDYNNRFDRTVPLVIDYD